MNKLTLPPSLHWTFNFRRLQLRVGSLVASGGEDRAGIGPLSSISEFMINGFDASKDVL